MTTEDFITRANEVHKDKFDYSKVDYKNRLEKVIIICKTHGEFLQPPAAHIGGSGCLKCARQKQKDWHNTRIFGGGVKK